MVPSSQVSRGAVSYCNPDLYQDPDLWPAVIWPDVGDGAKADQQGEGDRVAVLQDA